MFATNVRFGTVRPWLAECCEYTEREEAGLGGRGVLLTRSPVLEVIEDIEGLRLTGGVLPVSRSLGVTSGKGRGTLDIMQRYMVCPTTGGRRCQLGGVSR